MGLTEAEAGARGLSAAVGYGELAASLRGITLGEDEGALAEREAVAPPSITKIVNNLEEHGLVVRTGDPDDRRITRVATSDAGDRLVLESRRRKTAWLAGRIGQLDADQQRRLADALDVLDLLTEERS